MGHLHPDPLICLGPDFPCVGHPVFDLIGFFSEVVVLLGIRGNVLVVLIFADNKLEAIIGTSSLSDNATKRVTHIIHNR